MTTVIFGNHTAVRARREDRDRIRAFYRDVLGCTLMREFDDKDDFRMGDAFYFTFLYGSGKGVAVDQGVSYAAEDALNDEDFLKAIFLELKSDNVGETRRRIVAFGVRVLEVPDPHLYFQAPGGQVFRLVGIDEDMSRYEATTPPQPGSITVMRATSTYENVHADESPMSGAADEATVSRGTRRHRFDGEISGEGTADIIIARGTADRLGYVATERFAGSVLGKSGTFLMQHGAAIDRGVLAPFGYIVPGTGTGELVGIRGEVQMAIDTLTLTYEFEA